MRHVLIVDDSNQVRERLIDLLSECPGILIAGQAGNGKEALAAVNELKPDVVILDIRLPGKSGIQLLKEIKAAHPQTMVIMLTNYDFEPYRNQCMQLGADYFFNKTLEFEKVITVLTDKASGADVLNDRRV
jgi:DNA-binding NarL/FixJ family response regulator